MPRLRNALIRIVGWLVLVAVVVLLFVLPLVTGWLLQLNQMPSWLVEHLGTLETVQRFTMRAFVWTWVFFLGSCFASFLNVVAWRVPRGRSILGSSHCPKCGVRLSFWQNLPIIGWLRSGGCCANCQSPISIRYLVAEMVLGAAFVILFGFEVVSGGANLPGWPASNAGGIENVLMQPNVPLFATFVYHATLLSLLFTNAIIASERRPLPVVIFGFGLLFGLGQSLILLASTEVAVRIAGVGSLIYGFVAAVIAGTAISWSSRYAVSRNAASPWQAFWALPLPAMVWIGIFLDWQSVILITAIYCVVTAVVLLMVAIEPVYREINSVARILVATLIYLCFWKSFLKLAQSSNAFDGGEPSAWLGTGLVFGLFLMWLASPLVDGRMIEKSVS